MFWMRLTIGPSDHGSGTDYYLVDENGALDSGGWAGRPRKDTTDAWFKYAQRHLALPTAVRHLGWAGAVVKPFGWSMGAGHAPGGIQITWG